MSEDSSTRRSGQVPTDCPFRAGPSPSYRFRHKVTIEHRDLAGAILKDPSLGWAEYKLAWVLLYHIGYENSLPVCQADLAREFGFDRTALNRSLRKLREAGIVIDEGKGPGGMRILRFSAAYAWKGKARGHGRVYERDARASAEAKAKQRRARLKLVQSEPA